MFFVFRRNVGYYVAKMWSPTHVQVTVQRARELSTKGNHGVFVTIGLGKDKYQTSVKERDDSGDIEWREKCELKIPSQGNTASIVLTVLSPNVLGIDTFLGCVSIPLAELDVYDRPKNKWYELQDRQGRPKHKERGELEVKIGFSVRPGSLNDVSKKDGRRASLGQLSQVAHNVGGSLASISSVDKKSFKKLAKTITKKIKKEKKVLEEEMVAQSSPKSLPRQITGDADPGVVSDEDEFAFDNLSHTGSGCSLEVTHASHHSGSVETVGSSDVQPVTPTLAASTTHIPSTTLSPPTTPLGVSPRRDKEHANKFNTLPSSKPPRSITPIQEKFAHKWEQRLQEAKRAKAALNKSSERIVEGGEAKSTSPVLGRLSPEVVRQYENKSREDLVEMVEQLRNNLNKAQKERKDLEEYIDNLLLRIMEHSPNILQNPYAS